MPRTYKPGRDIKQWRKDNVEHIKEYRKQYRQKNKDKFKVWDKEKYQKRKETILENQRNNRVPYKDWPEERKEKVRENNRKYYQQRKQQRNDCNKRYRWENGEKIAIAKRKHWLTYRYGISIDEYENLFNLQNGVCLICHKPENRPNKKLAVDHDHATGKIRGLLCDKCNRALGYFDENIESMKEAIKYLQSNSST